MKKLKLIAALLVITTAAHSQITRELDAFKQLDVTDKINVKLIPSTFDKIIIDGELAAQVELIQVNDALRLKMTGSNVLQGNKVSVTLYTSKVMSIISRKGALVSSDDKTIKADSIYLSANEGANIDIAVNSKVIKSLSTTGGSIFLDGQTINQDVEIAAGGSFLARDMTSLKAFVRVSAGGKALITVTESIDAQTRAGGIIDVYGNPKDRKQKRFAGGKISFY